MLYQLSYVGKTAPKLPFRHRGVKQNTRTLRALYDTRSDVMPELPEVEHARRCLQRWIGSAQLVSAKVLDPRILKGSASVGVVQNTLRDRSIQRVTRRGKWLRIEMGPLPKRPTLLFSHLGMTGKWVLAPADEPVRFEKVRFTIEKRGARRFVSFIDPRLFGRFFLASADPPEWNALGPDPLLDGIDVVALSGKLARRSASIKPTLLDQSVLAGIGNIQATEALFFSRIDPRRPARSLSRTDVTALAAALQQTIERTLLAQAGPKIMYVEEAGAQNPFVIYEREGEPCPRCRRPLHKIFLSGRGSVFCPHCQR